MAQIKKIADGKFLIRVSRGTGKSRRFVNKTFHGTLKDARAEAWRQETLLDQGIAPQSLLDFESFLTLWLAAIKTRVAPRTLDGYEGYIRRYALEPLKLFKSIADIRPHHIQKIYVEIGKSPGTVRQLHASLNALFGWAMKREYLHANPCKHADLPRRTRKEVEVLTPAEAVRLNNTCRDMPNGVIFEFALETGMRPEEYLALRWSDISGRNVSVQQIVQFNRKGGGFYFSQPKTPRSRRMISISETLQKRLVAHRLKQNERRLAMKGTWFNLGLIFPDTIGHPIPLHNLTRRYFKPILDKCDLGKHIKLYSLRHSCATLLIMAGYNAKIVADRLGHASTVMTLDVYSHVMPHNQDEATDAMDRILRKVI